MHESANTARQSLHIYHKQQQLNVTTSIYFAEQLHSHFLSIIKLRDCTFPLLFFKRAAIGCK